MVLTVRYTPTFTWKTQATEN